MSLGVIERHFVVDQLAAERNLHPFEAELRGERNSLGVGVEHEIPIGDADLQLFARGEGGRGGEGGSAEACQATGGELNVSSSAIVHEAACREQRRRLAQAVRVAASGRCLEPGCAARVRWLAIQEVRSASSASVAVAAERMTMGICGGTGMAMAARALEGRHSR